MAGNLNIPIFFPRAGKARAEGLTILAGDVGGTKSNLAYYEVSNNGLKLIAEATYHSADFHSCSELIKAFYVRFSGQKPNRICLGVAGPVLGGRVYLTNLNWSLDIDEIKHDFGVDEVALLNDLEATAYGLEGLGADDLINIHEGSVEYPGNMAIIAPGTGLGEAGLYWDGEFCRPFPTEGGHTDFSPRKEIDMKLLEWLNKKYEVVSWEKVIAGPAIHDIYEFLSAFRKRKEPDWLTKILEDTDPSAAISQLGLEEKDSVCTETMQLFVRYLARESANLVLKMKATGGLFLGGGIPPKITPLLQQNVFYDNFLDCDRLQYMVAKVPIKIILNPKTALLGAGFWGAFGAPQAKV